MLELAAPPVKRNLTGLIGFVDFQKVDGMFRGDKQSSVEVACRCDDYGCQCEGNWHCMCNPDNPYSCSPECDCDGHDCSFHGCSY